jgi:hypothetical protein
MSNAIAITLVLIPIILHQVELAGLAVQDKAIMLQTHQVGLDRLAAHRLELAVAVGLELPMDRLGLLAVQVLTETHQMEVLVLLVVLLVRL